MRYSATRRRAKASKQADAAVFVNIRDFIGHKTALLGMTRMGKSNTAKIIIARTFVVSERERAAGHPPIGQLIFDPQGEYANPNTQDGTEIAAIGGMHVRIFKFGADGSQAHVRPLAINFYEASQIDAVQSLVADRLSDEDAGYVKDFVATSLGDADNDLSQSAHAQRARLLLYAALVRAGFQRPVSLRVRINIAGPFQAKVVQEMGCNPFVQTGSQPHLVTVGVADLEDVCAAVVTLRAASDTDALNFCKDARWKAVEPTVTGRADNRVVRGGRT